MSLMIFPPRGPNIWVIAGVGLAAVVAIALAAHQWNRLWDRLPWSAEARLERALEQAVHDRDQAVARTLESQAQADQTRRAEAAHHDIITVRDITTPVVTQARSAPDATEPLDPRRLDRLRDHDRQLCRMAVAACGDDPAAPSDAASVGN